MISRPRSYTNTPRRQRLADIDKLVRCSESPYIEDEHLPDWPAVSQYWRYGCRKVIGKRVVAFARLDGFVEVEYLLDRDLYTVSGMQRPRHERGMVEPICLSRSEVPRDAMIAVDTANRGSP